MGTNNLIEYSKVPTPLLNNFCLFSSITTSSSSGLITVYPIATGIFTFLPSSFSIKSSLSFSMILFYSIHLFSPVILISHPRKSSIPTWIFDLNLLPRSTRISSINLEFSNNNVKADKTFFFLFFVHENTWINLFFLNPISKIANSNILCLCLTTCTRP